MSGWIKLLAEQRKQQNHPAKIFSHPPSHFTMSAYEIPQQQRAAVRAVDDATKCVAMELIDVPQPGPGQILVKITWSGVCGTDKSFLRDEWKDVGVTMKPESKGIAGHEGVGIVVAVGDGEYTTKIPDGVTDQEAAPILCGGVTAYLACKKYEQFANPHLAYQKLKLQLTDLA